MNKKTLLNKISSGTGLKRKELEKIFDRILNLVYDEVTQKKYCHVEEFGDFVIEHRKQRKETDKKSKKEMMLPPRDRLKFYPSGHLIKFINTDERKNA